MFFYGFSPSPKYRYSDRRRGSNKYRDAERQRQIEERRVIYVGKIAEGSTRADLRRRFEIFGPVIDISLHFRERGYRLVHKHGVSAGELTCVFIR